MGFDSDGVAGSASGRRGPLAALWRVANRARCRLGWGVADQAVSSISNFAVSIYIARELGAGVYGAFTLAYVTYAFLLNASRGLATDPFLVRYSGTDVPTWRRAVAACTGTAAVVGLAAGACTLVVGACLGGTTRLAFLALGMTLPVLLLQDSWRFAFFARGRGSLALINDAVWTVALLLMLVLLRTSDIRSVFWYIFAWGASAGLGAALGPFQAKVVPRLSDARQWLSRHRDLGPRYVVEGTANSGSAQLQSYGISLILGLAALGYVQAANTLMGPLTVVFFGLGLVLLPEAVRALSRAPQHLLRFSVLASAGLALFAAGWGAVLLVALPRGLGYLVLHSLWRPVYPLVLPLAIQMMGGCVTAGAGIGLHALGAARRSMRAMIVMGIVYVPLTVVGASIGGDVGTIRGGAIAAWMGAVLFWVELRAALREKGYDPVPIKRVVAAIAGAPHPAPEGSVGRDEQDVDSQTPVIAGEQPHLSHSRERMRRRVEPQLPGRHEARTRADCDAQANGTPSGVQQA